MNLTTMTYGSFNFQNIGPIPFLTINKQYIRNEDGTKLGSRYNVTIDGTITPLPSGNLGIIAVDNLQDQLVSGFDLDGQHFEVGCNGTTILSSYPRINSLRLDKSNDNWYQTTPYTIDMEWDGENYSGLYIDSLTENWNIEFDDQNSIYNWSISGTGDNNTIVMRLNHSVSAKGIAHYDAGGLVKQPWQYARDAVMQKLGYDSTQVAQTGVLNINTSNMSGYNHMRTVTIDESAGSYAVNENWLVANFGSGSNAGKALEDFTASVKYSVDNGLISVDVQGNIQGVETRSYGSSSGGFHIIQDKYSAASGYWINVKPKIFGRAVLATDNSGLHPEPLSWSIGKNPTKGVINYSYSYDNRPTNFIAGALSENIQITDSLPTDVFASVVVLGRARGPILQDINTVTANRRNINIDLVMPITGIVDVASLVTTKPSSKVNSMLCTLQTLLTNEYSQVFKSADQENWNPKTGRYNRSVEWTYTSCSGTAPSTDFCS